MEFRQNRPQPWRWSSFRASSVEHHRNPRFFRCSNFLSDLAVLGIPKICGSGFPPAEESPAGAGAFETLSRGLASGQAAQEATGSRYPWRAGYRRFTSRRHRTGVVLVESVSSGCALPLQCCLQVGSCCFGCGPSCIAPPARKWGMLLGPMQGRTYWTLTSCQQLRKPRRPSSAAQLTQASFDRT